jgi:hypothetical protein
MASTNSFTLTFTITDPPPPPEGYTPLGDSALAVAIAALAAGASASFTLDASWNWTGSWFTNTIGRWLWGPHKAYFLGKSSGTGGNWRLIVYDEETNSFTSPFNNVGGLNTDSDNGDFMRAFAALDFEDDALYAVPYRGERAGIWNPDTATWDNTGVYTTGDGAGPWGLEWHPNLFGAGDGGLVLQRATTVFAWRKSTGVWSQIGTLTSIPTTNSRHQIGVYCELLDKVVFSHGHEGDYLAGGRPWWLINPGATPTVTRGTGDLPLFVSCFPSASDGISRRNAMLATPAGSVAIFECTNAANPQRVWRLNTSTLEWELQAFEHPFRFSDALKEYGTPMFVPDYGAYWRLCPTATNNPGQPNSLIWKPPSGF